jgi:hypothetical protein
MLHKARSGACGNKEHLIKIQSKNLFIESAAFCYIFAPLLQSRNIQYVSTSTVQQYEWRVGGYALTKKVFIFTEKNHENNYLLRRPGQPGYPGMASKGRSRAVL